MPRTLLCWRSNPRFWLSCVRKSYLCSRSQLVVSVAAGTPLARLESWLGSDTAIVRCMPNTPALIGKGVSGLIANANTSESQKALASDLMAAVGITSG